MQPCEDGADEPAVQRTHQHIAGVVHTQVHAAVCDQPRPSDQRQRQPCSQTQRTDHEERDGELRAHDLAAGLVGAVVKDPGADATVWQEYLETVVKRRDDWQDLYRACKELG